MKQSIEATVETLRELSDGMKDAMEKCWKERTQFL